MSEKTETAINLPVNATIHNHVGDFVGVKDVWRDTTRAERPSPCEIMMDMVHTTVCDCRLGHDVAKPMV